MSSFSNTDTGSKPADPYKAKNLDDASIKEKVEDLSEFISNCKFGMMTTRDGTTGRLVSRCMALAAKVCPLFAISYIMPYPSSLYLSIEDWEAVRAARNYLHHLKCNEDGEEADNG